MVNFIISHQGPLEKFVMLRKRHAVSKGITTRVANKVKYYCTLSPEDLDKESLS